MLARMYSILQENNPELTERRRYTLKPPEIMRMGTTRTCWMNFAEICTMSVGAGAPCARMRQLMPWRASRRMKRQPEHVMSYFLSELGTEGSLDGSNRFVFRGKFIPKKIESLLRKYIGA